MTEEKLRTYIETHSQRKDAGRAGSLGKADTFPFRVPEGYFDTFADRMMSRISEQEVSRGVEVDAPSKFSMPSVQTDNTGKPGSKHRVLIPRIWRYVAASIVVAFVVGAGVMLTQTGGAGMNEQMQLASNVSELQMQLLDEDDADMYQELDYAMVDNHEIAAYLTENIQ